MTVASPEDRSVRVRRRFAAPAPVGNPRLIQAVMNAGPTEREADALIARLEALFAGGGACLVLQEVRTGVRLAPHRMSRVPGFAPRRAARFGRAALVGDAGWPPTRAHLLRVPLRREIRRSPAGRPAGAREWPRTGKRRPHGLRPAIRG